MSFPFEVELITKNDHKFTLAVNKPPELLEQSASDALKQSAYQRLPRNKHKRQLEGVSVCLADQNRPGCAVLAGEAP
jgi:hypothetical protein